MKRPEPDAPSPACSAGVPRRRHRHRDPRPRRRGGPAVRPRLRPDRRRLARLLRPATAPAAWTRSARSRAPTARSSSASTSAPPTASSTPSAAAAACSPSTPRTARATRVASLDVPLRGGHFGIDVNPAADALRIVSNTGQNLRHAFAGNVTTADSPLNVPDTTPRVRGVVGAAYTNNDKDDTTGTALYDLNADQRHHRPAGAGQRRHHHQPGPAGPQLLDPRRVRHPVVKASGRR